MVWASNVFLGVPGEIKLFSVTVHFTSRHSTERWSLVSTYGLCAGPNRTDFVTWLKEFDLGLTANWLLLGDFYFYRSTNNRNRPGADMNDMLIFNDIISSLGLLEIPLKGRSFTWSNMQASPLLERL